MPAPQTPAEDRATRERGRRTVAQLIDSAIEEFTAHGYHGARIARIAERAGTSYGTFYLYFTDKDDVLWEAIGGILRGKSEVLASLDRFTPGAAGRRSLSEWVRRVCDFWQQNMPLTQAMIDAQASSAEIAERGVEVLSGYRRILAARIRDSDAIGIDPNLGALVIYATLERANAMYFNGSLVASYPELVTALTEFTHLALFGASPPEETGSAA